MRIQEGWVFWLNGVPSSALRRPREQEEENTAPGRPCLLSRGHWRTPLRDSVRESDILLFPFLWDLSHLLREGSGANGSKFLVWNEALSIKELTKQRNEGGGGTASQKPSRRMRNKSAEKGSELIWKLSREREVFEGELLGKGLNCTEENVRKIFTWLYRKLS